MSRVLLLGVGTWGWEWGFWVEEKVLGIWVEKGWGEMGRSVEKGIEMGLFFVNGNRGGKSLGFGD